MEDMEKKIQDGELDLTKLFTLRQNSIKLACPVKKINFDKAEDKQHIIGMQLLLMDEDKFNELPIDDDDLNNDTLLCISQYQMIEDLSIIHGALNIFINNNLLKDYTAMDIINDIISIIGVNGFVNYSCFISKIEYIFINMSNDIEQGLSHRLELLIKKVWFMTYATLDGVYESAIKEFNEHNASAKKEEK